ADTGVEVRQQGLLGNDLVVADFQTVERLPAQGTAEETVLPLREQVAAIEGQPRWSERRVPVIDRLLHPVLGGVAIADPNAVVADGVGRSRIFDAVADHRPAVIGAFFYDVDLVSTFRTDVGIPQLACLRVEGETFRTAKAISPDFGPRTRGMEEGIVGRRRAVGRDVNDLAQVIVQLLCHVPW